MIRQLVAQPTRIVSTSCGGLPPRAAGALALAIGLAGALAGSSRAQPEDKDAAVVAAARALAVDGVKLAQAGRCGEAIEKLQRAESLHHSAIVLAQLGQCYVDRGRLVEGGEALRAVLREPLPDDPSEAMQKAYAGARATLESIQDRIAKLTLTLDAVQGAEPKVSIDGRPVPAALIGVERPTDPGEHVIEASAPGYFVARRTLTLDPGQAQTVQLSLVLDPASVHARAPARRDAQPDPTAPAGAPPMAAKVAAEDSRPSRLPAYIAWGAGLAGLGVGIGFGWVAIDQKSDLDIACPAGTCPPAERGRLEAARRNGVISSVGFGVALAGAAAGTLLFLLAGAEQAERAETSPKAPARAAAPLGGSGLTLSF